jgi:hypothetical protein
MTFEQAMRHKRIVLEVAVGARAEDKGPLLGVLYDELARFVIAILSFIFPFVAYQEGVG